MKLRNAVLTGVTGLMLNVGLGSAVFAQPAYGVRHVSMRGNWRAEQMVRQDYREILGREPDPSGMREYTDAIVNRGWSNGEVRRSLLQSPEYAQRFGRARSGWGNRNR